MICINKSISKINLSDVNEMIYLSGHREVVTDVFLFSNLQEYEDKEESKLKDDCLDMLSLFSQKGIDIEKLIIQPLGFYYPDFDIIKRQIFYNIQEFSDKTLIFDGPSKKEVNNLDNEYLYKLKDIHKIITIDKELTINQVILPFCFFNVKKQNDSIISYYKKSLNLTEDETSYLKEIYKIMTNIITVLNQKFKNLEVISPSIYLTETIKSDEEFSFYRVPLNDLYSI